MRKTWEGPRDTYLWIFHSTLRQLIVFSSSKNSPMGINSKSVESGVNTVRLLMLQRNMLLNSSLELRCFMNMVIMIMKLIVINNNAVLGICFLDDTVVLIISQILIRTFCFFKLVRGSSVIRQHILLR